MADIKISGLTAVATVVPGTDVIPIVSGGATTKATPNQIVNAVLNGATAIGIGTSNPLSKLMVYGAGQTTANLADAGVRTNIIRISDSGAAAGNGGAITFGNVQADNANSLGFAAIKGLLTNGSGNTTGDLAFSLRTTTADTALTECMRITTAGNVGIGTTPASAYKLDVNGSAKITNVLLRASAGEGGELDFENAAGTATAALIDIDSANNFRHYNALATSSIFFTNSAERMRIDSAGNVGIGTSSPLRKLQVVGQGFIQDATNPSLYLGNTLADYNSIRYDPVSKIGYVQADGAGTQLVFGTANLERIRIDASGNVGIGTTAPTTWGKLAVVGASSGGQVVASIVNTSGTANTQAVLSFDTTNNGFNVRDSQIRATNNGGNLTTLEFYTSNSATPVERMRIDSSGNTFIARGNLLQYAPTPTSITASATLTGAQARSDLIVASGAGPWTITMPTGTLLDAEFPAPLTNVGFDIHIINTSTTAVTVAQGASGMTTVGSLTVATGTSAAYRMVRTAAATYILYRIS